MKFDIHVHITPPDICANPEKYSEKEPYFSMLSRSKVNKFSCAQDVIAAMEKNDIDRAAVFGFGFRDIGLCRYVNDYVIESVKQFPQKLSGFTVVPPAGKEASDEIERCFNAGLKGAGELFPQGQGIDLENKNDTAFITGVCKERGLPLMLHINEPVGHSYPGKTDTTLRRMETFIKNNPGLKIILAHFGGGLFFYESMNEIREMCRDVYYDTAAAPFIYDYRIYNTVKTLDLCEKILFGSDYPILPPSRYMDGIGKSILSEEEKNLILGGNAVKLLGI